MKSLNSNNNVSSLPFNTRPLGNVLVFNLCALNEGDAAALTSVVTAAFTLGALRPQPHRA